MAEDYFSTIGIPIVSGREFARADNENAPPVAIINQTMAAKYWPGKNALGQRLKVKDRWMEIVGIAKNANYRNKLERVAPFFYVPLRQNFGVQNNLLIRTRQSSGAIMNASGARSYSGRAAEYWCQASGCAGQERKPSKAFRTT